MESEPIAIIGIGCRFPGSSGPQEFWQSIRDGLDAITEVKSDSTGTTATARRHPAAYRAADPAAAGAPPIR